MDAFNEWLGYLGVPPEVFDRLCEEVADSWVEVCEMYDEAIEEFEAELPRVRHEEARPSQRIIPKMRTVPKHTSWKDKTRLHARFGDRETLRRRVEW